MDEYVNLGGVAFEWDIGKAGANPKNHDGITFVQAATAFFDASALQFFDEEHSEEENRYVLIGVCSTGTLMRVSFTERPPNIRLFSARLANRYDERRYADGY